LGLFRRGGDILRAFVNPSGEVRPQNRNVRVVTRDGATITGKLLHHDSFTVLLIDSTEQLRSLPKTSSVELTNLVRYLASLQGVKATTP
jgi:small nuclear ribonucleoprotein (snRNP)-like protein